MSLILPPASHLVNGSTVMLQKNNDTHEILLGKCPSTVWLSKLPLTASCGVAALVVARFLHQPKLMVTVRAQLSL